MAETSSATIQKKRRGEWTETCIGVWFKSALPMLQKSDAEKSTTTCYGLNLVKIKNMDINAVQPTSTLGVQIIIHDSDVNEETNHLPTSSELSVTEQIYTTYEKNLGDFQQHLKGFQESSSSLAETLKKFKYSAHKFNDVSKFVSKEYNDLRNWFENYWK